MADRKAPDPQSHVRQFISTVDDLERFAALYPIPTSTNLIYGHGDNDGARWIVIMHALMLRKYFADGDELNLSGVAESLQQITAENDHEMTPDDWDLIRANVAKLATNSTVIVGPDGVQQTESEVLRDELYGRYLHGDYGKWLHAQHMSQYHSDHMIMTATLNRLWRVQNFAKFIRVGVRDGMVSYD